MSHLLQPQIVILKEGTEDNSGRGQIIQNINACQAVVDVVKTTLGKCLLSLMIQFKEISFGAIFASESNSNFVLTLSSLLFVGPRGMDKLIHDGRSVTISNDGATLIGLLDIVHPAAKTLVDIAQSQDN